MNRLPEKLGHYRLLDKIGEGGMGVVYKAIDTHLDRTVALKVLPPEKLVDSERKRRFAQEAKTASALNHPNIVTIHDISSDMGIDFMVMEWIDGRTLDELIPRHGMRLPEVLRIAVQIAEGLSAAHGAGITHRDIKPSNIMVSNAGHVKVLDFGLAKLTERAEVTVEDKTVAARPLTSEGAIIGTVCYMSPEQAEGKKVDPRTDIFSFGSVLYEMASGQRAFQGDTPASTLGAVIHTQPKPLAELVPALPNDLERLIARCLRKDRARRMQGMADIRVALLDLKEDSDSGQLSSTAVAPPSRRRWGLPVAFGSTLLLGALGLLWNSRSKQSGALPEPRLTQITRDSGTTYQPVLSPDGKLLAYASNRADAQNMDIWVQQMAGGQPVRLTRHPAADTNPQFSPDGTTIYFLSQRAEGSVWAIPTLGGDERVVTRDPLLYQNLLAPNGQLLAHKRLGYNGEPSPCYLLSTVGGGSRKVETSIQSFIPETWSPDSRMLIGWGREGVAGPDPGDAQLYLVPASGGPAILIKTNAGATVTRAGIGSVRLVGTRLFFSEQGAIDEYTLSGNWRLDGPIKRWATFPGANVQFAISDRVILAANLTGVEDIWSIPMDTNRGKVNGAPERLTNDEARDWWPSLSANGRKMIYTSDRHGNRDVWLRAMESGKETQVTATPESERRARISPDGERVAYEVESKPIAIFVREIAGGEPRLVCQNCGLPGWTPDSRRVSYWDGSPVRFHTFDPATGDRRKLVGHPVRSIQSVSFAPDGQWISFHLLEESGRTQIYIAGVRNGEAAEPSQWIPVIGSDRRYTHAWWSPDGNMLYFLDRAYRAMFAQVLDPVSKRPKGEPLPLFEPIPGMNFVKVPMAGFSMVPDRMVLSMVQFKANLWRIE